MGALTSRQNAGVEEVDVVSNHAYKYPPRCGNYFGSHFIMGGERFDTPQPEAYLFGENADLNFLGSRPTPFPYPPPQSNEPTKTLKSLVNIRKESLRFVRCQDSVLKASDHDCDGLSKATQFNYEFNIEFTFDSDARCAITIYYFCTEEITPNGVVYYPRDVTMNSQTYRYKRGANQQFCQSLHIFDPTKYPEEDLSYNSDREIIPIAIHCVVEEGTEEMRQSHTTIAVVEKHSDGTYILKALKQKLFVDGLSYLLQEIYGIENKNNDNKANSDEETDDNGSECVICMCDVRDTLILPCRHLCLCNSCADSLRYQANNCPICRAPFRALLQIRALQNLTGPPRAIQGSPPDGSMENIPVGYEPVSLIEALNGPCMPRAGPPPTPQLTHAPALVSHATQSTQPTQPAIASPDGDNAAQAADILNRSTMERTSTSSLGSGSVKKLGIKITPKEIEGKSLRDRALAQASGPELRMSVLLAREEESKVAGGKMGASSPLLVNQRNNRVGQASLDNTKNVLKCAATPYTTKVDESEAEVVECEADSEAEKLSPLLTKNAYKTKKCNGNPVRGKASLNGPTGPSRASAPMPSTDPHLEAVMEPVDDMDTDQPKQLFTDSVGTTGVLENDTTVMAEDSDYFTPEDTATTIFTVPHNPVKGEALTCSSSESSPPPQRWPLPVPPPIPHHLTSLPGTPLSHMSNRSSGDSYSSSSSTRQLLAPGGSGANNALATHT